VPARDRRTVGEASADTDALPRGVLLDVKGPNTGQDLAPGFQSPAQRSRCTPCLRALAARPIALLAVTASRLADALRIVGRPVFHRFVPRVPPIVLSGWIKLRVGQQEGE
jgi:hypothetical protein